MLRNEGMPSESYPVPCPIWMPGVALADLLVRALQAVAKSSQHFRKEFAEYLTVDSKRALGRQR